MPGGFLAISSYGNDDYSESTCGFDSPLQDLGWLCEENPTEDMRYCFIAKAKANGKTVIMYGDCNPLINKIISILGLHGEIIERREPYSPGKT